MLDGLASEYALLAARAARLLPGLAEVPPAVRRRVLDEPRPRASALVRDAGRLRVALAGAGLDTPRARFLAAQLRACEATVRRLAGQDREFVAEVADTFGVTVRPGSEEDYAAAHRAIGELLPGTGPLARRWAEHRRVDEVPPALLLPALRALTGALRELVPWRLPHGEQVGYRLVADAPWAALHSWSGGGRSLVSVNRGARVRWSQLSGLVAHESYPGHHVQRCRAELAGPPERRVVLTCSPQSVVAEGAAEAGLDVLVGPGWGRWAREVLSGVADIGGELAERLAPAVRALAPVRLDAALLLNDRRLPYGTRAERARLHLERWLLVDPPRAARIVDGLAAPRWRGYVAAHVEGPLIVNNWLRGDAGAVHQRYVRLLDEPLLPADLQARPADTITPVVAEIPPVGEKDGTNGRLGALDGAPMRWN